jgi:hypothetical protein
VLGSAVAFVSLDTLDMINTRTGWSVCVLLLTSAVLSGGCYVEQRGDGKWWACDTVQTPQGPVTGCQPIEMPLVK